METKILAAALYSRDAYEELIKYEVKESLSDQGKVLWELFETYYNKDSSADKIDKTLLNSSIDRLYPKHSDMLQTVVNNLEETSEINVVSEVIEQKLETTKALLSQAFSSTKDVKIEPLLEEYSRLVAGELEAASSSDIIIAPDLKELMLSRSVENRIRILPEKLNEALEGGALRGHHIVLFSVTDMGKSLMALNMTRGFIEDGLKVLYVGNEDPISDLIERFLVSLTGKNKHTVRKHYEKAQEVAEKKGWHNLVWAELSPGTLGEIRSLIEEHNPDVLVVDQIRNLDTGDKNFVRVLEVAAQSMRNFAKKYNLLSVSVTQAGDSANGKAILNRGDIDNSNVGIPGTADLMLGIGATQDQEFDGIRTLSFPKNKISGSKQPIQVRFNTTNMRVE